MAHRQVWEAANCERAAHTCHVRVLRPLNATKSVTEIVHACWCWLVTQLSELLRVPIHLNSPDSKGARSDCRSNVFAGQAARERWPP